MNEDTCEVLRGHFEDCLQHLGQVFASKIRKGSRGAAQAKKPIAEFCGVTIDSVTRWLHGTGSLPVGKLYIKLMCFLDMTGYRVIELENMSKPRRNFIEFIGYGLFSSDQAAEFLGYRSTSTLYQVLQGNHRISEDKDQKMWDLFKERVRELQQEKERLQKLYRLDIPLKTELSKISGRQMSASRSEAIVSIMKGLLALIDESSIEKLFDDGQADLKESSDTILHLLAHLSALHSRLVMSEKQ